MARPVDNIFVREQIATVAPHPHTDMAVPPLLPVAADIFVRAVVLVYPHRVLSTVKYTTTAKNGATTALAILATWAKFPMQPVVTDVI